MSARIATLAAWLLCACACATPARAATHANTHAAKARAPHAAKAAPAASATKDSTATGAPEGAPGDAKEVSGMSIVGNSEAPKSLTIIPWKSSEIGRDADFKSTLLSQDIVPIDKPTFLRGLDFFEASTRPQGH